eukprot:826680-Alexandrium_andersonii.AAC.1
MFGRSSNKATSGGTVLRIGAREFTICDVGPPRASCSLAGSESARTLMQNAPVRSFGYTFEAGLGSRS